MFFRIKRNEETLIVGDDILSLSGSFEINATGSFTVLFPLKYAPYLLYKNSLFIALDDGRKIQGIATSKTIDEVTETISVDYAHELDEWQWESVPINVVKKNAEVGVLMDDPDIAYVKTPWDIKVFDDYTVEFEFSRETKREALDKIIELTPDLNYRVSLSNPRHLEIGKFGEHKELLIHLSSLLESFSVQDDSSAIINYAVSLSDKADGGATSITLRDIYENPSLQLEGFPVLITGNTINTQAQQIGYTFTEYAPNNIIEYAIMDEEGIRREDGDIYEGTFSSNAVQPVQEDGESISNADRIKAAQTLYNQGVRKLKYSRRNLRFTVKRHEFPSNINVGDKIRVAYSEDFDTLTKCFGLYTARLLTTDEWLYVIQVSFELQEDGSLLYDITLSKDLAQYFSVREN